MAHTLWVQYSAAAGWLVNEEETTYSATRVSPCLLVTWFWRGKAPKMQLLEVNEIYTVFKR
jgi:hypothetical protein